jgi:glycosyltransferase involved in cell wall biosynthesis
MTYPAAWICCQLGAREHYAIPRALHQANQLFHFITDAWVPPQSPLNRLPGQPFKSLCDRNHPDLTTAPITAFTPGLIEFELRQRWQKTLPWPRMIARNQWFQQRAIQTLETLTPPPGSSPVLFTYSYAALDLLRYAKGRGWPTVLGQIDPGRLEEKIVQKEHRRHPHLAPHWQPVPPSYWETWQEECALADRIVVNSSWSKQLLEQDGVDPAKIDIVPLVYQPPAEAAHFVRTYPAAFAPKRPLRVLFLGLVTLRKGIAACLDAIEQLTGEPVEFWFVGPIEIDIPEHLRHHPQVKWIGPVPRSQTQHFYQQADVFLFPTLSDGFGLTQLEAQAWKLPIIASQFCGEIVQPPINGLVLSQGDGPEIATALGKFIADPQTLVKMSNRSRDVHSHSISVLAKQLSAVPRV